MIARQIFLGIVTIIQTSVGVSFIKQILNRAEEPLTFSSLVGPLLGLAVLAVISLFLRGYLLLVQFALVPEIILSPIAVARFFIGLVAYILSEVTDMDIVADDEEGPYNTDSPMIMLTQYLFGFYVEECTISKFSNILIQLFVCIPVAGLQTFCFWKAVDLFKNGAFPLIPLFFLFGVTLFSGLLCAIRGQESTVVYYERKYTFKNRYTKKKFTRYSSGRDEQYGLSDYGRSVGWEQTSGGYSEYFTGWMIFTWLFSPVMFFAQVIGLFFALISSPSTHIISSYAKVDYDYLSGSFFQRILQFFFNFVID